MVEIKSALQFLCFLLTRGTSLPTQCSFEVKCQCEADDTFLRVNCSGSDLTNLPFIPSNVITLDLSYNKISRLTNDSFMNLSVLTFLSLKCNPITFIESSAFAGLSRLKYLNMQNSSKGYSFNIPKQVFKPLVSLSYLNMKYIYSGFKISSETLLDLSGLEHLETDYAGFFPPIFEHNITKLTKFKSLTFGFCGSLYLDVNSFESVKYLEYVDILSCNVEIYSPNSITQLSNLRYLALKFKRAYKHQQTDPLVYDLQSLNVTTLLLQRAIFATLSFPADVFRILYKSTITKMIITDMLFVDPFVKPSTFDKVPENVRHLDLSNNGLSKFSFHIKNTVRLILRQNSLGRFFAESAHSKSKFTSLKFLDLSENEIFHLHFDIFKGHHNLQTLLLQENKLSDVTFDLRPLVKLKYLDLSGNKIQSLNDTTINVLSERIKRTNLTINLSQNQMLCNCQTFKFVEWIRNHRSNFVSYETYICKSEDGNETSMSNLQDIVEHLTKECASYTVVIILVSIGIVAACLIVIIGILYRYRWRLRYLYYMTKGKYHSYKPLDSSDIYTYDAFVSYSEQDEGLFLRDLIDELETKGGFKLCLHRRDFTPGEDITVNITTSIHESRKTICIITRSFLKSYYCMFEFNMARMESIYSRDGQNVLFLVFYESISPGELSLVLLEQVQNKSYIEYPNDEQGNVVFWDKLRETLSRD